MKKYIMLCLAMGMLLNVCCVSAEASGEEHIHQACGASGCVDQVHLSGDHVQTVYEPYAANMTLADGMNVYLTEDITVNSTISVPADATVRLCLNGHAISKTGYGDTISVAGTLIMCDCSGDESGMITHTVNDSGTYQGSGVRLVGAMRLYSGRISGNANNYNDGGGVYIASAGNMVMYGGSIEENGNTYGEGGGVYMTGGSLTMRGGRIRQNLASRGGGVYMTGGNLTIYIGGIEDNKASSYGGGIHMSDASLAVHGGAISGNEAGEREGGGVYMTSGTYVMHGGKVAENKSAWDGGGIKASGGSVTIHKGSIRNNAGQAGGGVSADGELTIYGGEFTGNTATRGGGGISASRNTTITGGEIRENSSKWDGGGIAATGSLLMNGVKICFNSTPDYGGGVYIGSSGNAELTDCEIDGNTAEKGGGIAVDYNAVMKIAGSRISNNSGVSGGGVYLNSGNLTLDNNTVTSNTATSDYGGGIYVENNCVLTINGGIITSNTAGSDGGGLYVYDGEITINDGVITKNRTSGRGGGIYAQTLTLQGAVVVKENLSNAGYHNFFLNSGMITLAGPLTGGEGSVGICMDIMPYQDSPVNYMAPATGYVLRQTDIAAAWSEDGHDSRIGADGIAEFCLPKHYSVDVAIIPADSGTVKITSAYDNVSHGNPAKVSPGAYLKMTAKPEKGGSFIGWYQTERFMSAGETYYLPSIHKNTEYIAVFRPAETLRLSLALMEIKEESFEGTAIQAVEIAHGCSAIGARAFAACEDLAWIRIPSSVTAIADDAFEGCGNLVIISPENSDAQTYAYNHGLMWINMQ